MSGHSHWSSIKYKKGTADAKKSKAFSKIAKELQIATKEGGKDLQFNAKLRLAIERAKDINMPQESIERAIKKGAGEMEGTALENIVFEAFGPGGIAIIIEAITDNKNRSIVEIKQALNQNGGKFASEGAVKWMFEQRQKEGRLEWAPKYEIEASKEDQQAAEKLFRALDEIEDVQEIYSNLKL